MTTFENVMSSDFLRMSQTTPFETQDEVKYYRLWCSSTVHEVLPYCQYALHSTMLYGACTIDSIRHAVIALAALHKAAMAAQYSRSRSIDDFSLVSSRHHRNAIEHYSKAIQCMRTAMKRGDQDIRATLVACFITFGFEAFHGNLALAVAQVRTGVALMEEWKHNYVHRGQPPPDVEVLETWLCLEIQIISFHDNRSLEQHRASRVAFAERVRNMPHPFTSMWQATKFFYCVKKHAEHFLRIAQALIKRAAEHPTERESLYAEARSLQAHHIAELNQWHASYELLMSTPFTNTGPDEDIKARSTYLGLHFLHTLIEVKTVFATDEAIYDEYAAEFSEMMGYAVAGKDMQDSKPQTTNWTFDLGSVLPLYFVATKCRIRGIRTQALETMQRGPRREGIWDNHLVRKLGAWVQKIEEEHLEGDVVPAWARVEELKASFDLERRVVEMRCRQRSEKDGALCERSTRTAW
jgi:hypothetical protein